MTARVLLLVLVTGFLAGCGFQDRLKIGRGNELLMNTAGMDRTYLDRGGILWEYPGRATLDRYNRFLIQPVQVESRTAGDRSLTDAERDQIARHFREALIRELTDGGYEVVGLPGEDVLAIEMSVGGLVGHRDREAEQLIDIDARAGGITIQGVFRDTNTASVYAITLHRMDGERLSEWWGAPEDVMAHVGEAMDGWAALLRGAVDEAHGRVPAGETAGFVADD